MNFEKTNFVSLILVISFAILKYSLLIPAGFSLYYALIYLFTILMYLGNKIKDTVRRTTRVLKKNKYKLFGFIPLEDWLVGFGKFIYVFLIAHLIIALVISMIVIVICMMIVSLLFILLLKTLF